MTKNSKHIIIYPESEGNTMSKKKNTNSTYETIRHIRGDWGNINPVTKIIPNKKRNYVPDEDDYDSFSEYWHDLHHANYNEDYKEYE